MKRGYKEVCTINVSKIKTIVSVIKMSFGEYITSRLIRMQNRELVFRCITYNVHLMVR